MSLLNDLLNRRDQNTYENIITVDADEFFRMSNEGYKDSNLFKFVKYTIPFELSEEGPWLAGGAIRRFILGQDLDAQRQDGGDLDFFFNGPSQIRKSKNLMKSVMWPNKSLLFYIGSMSRFSYTFHKHKSHEKIQLVKCATAHSAPALLDNFQYTCNQVAYDGKRIYISTQAVLDITNKDLCPVRDKEGRIRKPLGCFQSYNKYCNQGFKPAPGLDRECRKEIDRLKSIGAKLDLTWDS